MGRRARTTTSRVASSACFPRSRRHLRPEIPCLVPFSSPHLRHVLSLSLAACASSTCKRPSYSLRSLHRSLRAKRNALNRLYNPGPVQALAENPLFSLPGKAIARPKPAHGTTHGALARRVPRPYYPAQAARAGVAARPLTVSGLTAFRPGLRTCWPVDWIRTPTWPSRAKPRHLDLQLAVPCSRSAIPGPRVARRTHARLDAKKKTAPIAAYPVCPRPACPS